MLKDTTRHSVGFKDLFGKPVVARLPRAVKGRRWRLAIDLNLRPYYGQAHHRTEEVYRSQAQRGTTHFHAYATGYLVHRGRKLTNQSPKDLQNF